VYRHRVEDVTVKEPSPYARTITDPHATSTHAPVAARIGRYWLGEVIGAGGMGVVHRAHDPELNRDVAIKIVRATGAIDRERVLREAEAMARLRHPNVVPVFDVGTHDDAVYLVMPLLDGGTLGTWMRAERRRWRDVVTRFLAAARGLAAAHALGLVHRDFKPDNVLLGGPQSDEVQVADFGLARTVATDDSGAAATANAGGTAATRTGAVMGTPAYMAPEQLDGAVVDARADQYSFCVSLYEALHGQRPFAVDGTSPADLERLRESIRKGAFRSAKRPSPHWLRALMARGMRAEPSQRWQSMASLIVAFERGLGRRRRLVFMTTAIALLAAIASLVLVATQSDEPRQLRAETPWTERPLTSLGDITTAAVSPDGTEVAAVSGRNVVVVPISGGDPRVLVGDLDLGMQRISWSADGHRVLVTPLSGSLPHRTIEARSGEIKTYEWIKGRWAQLADGNLVEFHEAEMLLWMRRPTGKPIVCRLPVEYDFIDRIEMRQGVVYAAVSTGERVGLLAVSPTCASVRTLVDGFLAKEILVRDDGQVVAVVEGEERMELVELDDGKPSNTRRLPVSAVPGRQAIAGISSTHGVVYRKVTTSWRLRDPARPDAPDLMRGSGERTHVLSPDGSKFASVDGFPARGTVRITPLDAENGATDVPHGPTIAVGVESLAWSPDGSQLALLRRKTVDGNASIDIVAAETGVPLQSLPAEAGLGTLAWLDASRIAYQREDNKTYRWIDLANGAHYDLLDPDRGWTFDLTVSSYDGTMALHWNRPTHFADPPGIWLVRSDSRIERLRDFGDSNGRFDGYAWSLDGRSLWMYVQGSGEIDRYDLPTKRTTHVYSLDLAAWERIDAIFPTSDGRVLVQTSVETTDLVLFGP
jgi:hypothetical protein